MAEFRLETERLVLRSWREGDRDDWFVLSADPQVMAMLGPVMTREESDAMVDRMIGLQREQSYLFWAMERRSDQRMIGFCGVKPGAQGTPIEGAVEIGWRLRADAWGAGFAREAAEASLAWSWTNLDAPEVVAITNIKNTRSWGLMERLGMTRDPDGDFDHPALAEDDPLRPHILYRIQRPQ
jgi:RimJ/RimL family protein N-acetyltransferase